MPGCSWTEVRRVREAKERLGNQAVETEQGEVFYRSNIKVNGIYNTNEVFYVQGHSSLKQRQFISVVSLDFFVLDK